MREEGVGNGGKQTLKGGMGREGTKRCNGLKYLIKERKIVMNEWEDLKV